MKNLEEKDEEQVMCICGRSGDGFCHCAEWGVPEHIYSDDEIDDYGLLDDDYQDDYSRDDED